MPRPIFVRGRVTVYDTVTLSVRRGEGEETGKTLGQIGDDVSEGVAAVSVGGWWGFIEL